MSRYTDLPKPVRAGIVIDPDRGESQRVIVLQFNPETLERSLAPQSSGAEQGDRTEALRLKGPAIETWKFTAELDASDQPDLPSEFGIHPQLATLEMLVNPTSGQLKTNQALARLGTLEITPVETPLTLFVWGAKRVMPVRLTELTITEEAFDADLNPYRATVGIGLRVLSVNDLPDGHRGSDLYLAYLSQKEQFAGSAAKGRLETLGLRNL
ncbi:hypothetical protein [Amycolatopsis sp.]|jgi:hypothetical protein|uniref:hypothetical protein n=1 Tax=Amycolatopsis sp. TaxID=37632 RepID=UPI002DFF234B|nr:hypothetical protein [Amycolatopsis sp.]